MKNLSTISLFIFGIVLTSILTAGLVFYQNNKTGNNVEGNQTGNLVQGTISNLTSGGKSITLDMTEIAKHNKSIDCFMLISGKVYNITSFFGSHPGGNAAMEATCGTDATAAYATRDPYAKTSGTKINHSKSAQAMLANYYIGDLNQTIGQQKVTATNTVVAPKTSGDDEDDD
ncbi:MAG: cytochrome b5-like heme/steroid binding domain-containing protein [Candidatus Paceibacterota bacterium]